MMTIIKGLQPKAAAGPFFVLSMKSSTTTIPVPSHRLTKDSFISETSKFLTLEHQLIRKTKAAGARPTALF